MNRLVLCIAALATCFVACADPFSTPPTVGGDADSPTLVLHPDGHLWLSYADPWADTPMVARWSGATWETVGTPHKAAVRNGDTPGELMFDGEGHAFIGTFEWQTQTATLRGWDGQAWSQVIQLAAGTGTLPQLRVSPAGQPIALWTEFQDIHVQAWTGSAWKAVGDGLASNIVLPPGQQGPPFLNNPTMVFDAAGNPVVAHLEGSLAFGFIWVQRWTGTAWEVVGGPMASERNVTDVKGPLLALDADGRPYVAWATSEGTGKLTSVIEVRRWSGSAWEKVGGAISVENASPAGEWWGLRLDAQGRPVVSFVQGVWSDQRIHVRRWSGSAWEAMGQPLAGPQPGYIQKQTLAIDSDGSVVVAWAQHQGQSLLTPGYNQIFVHRFTE